MIIYYRNNPSITLWEIGNQTMPVEEAETLTNYIKQYDHHGGDTTVSCGTYDETVASSRRVTGVRRGDETMVPYVDIGITTEGSGGMDSETLGSKPQVEGEYNRSEARRGVWDRYTEGWEDYHTGEGSDYDQTAEEYACGQISSYNKKISDDAHCGGANWIFSDSTSHGRVTSEVARVSGEVDAVMLPKEAYYSLGVVQASEPSIYLIGHWNYAEGTVKNIEVAANTASVKLFLNDELIGTNEKPTAGYRFTFKNVTWQAGTLTAVGYDADGNEVCRSSKSTHGEPAMVRLTPNTGTQGLLANGSDILLIDAEVVDADGNRCLTYDGQLTGKKIEFTINDDNGCSIWRGGYNSGIENSTNDKSLYIEAGINRVAVKTTMKAGDITVTGSIDGLESDTITVTSKEVDNTGGISTVLPETPSYSLNGLTDPGVGNDRHSSGTDDDGYTSTMVENFSYTGNGDGKIATAAAIGGKLYTDSDDIVFETLPDELVGMEYVQTANTDAQYLAVDMTGFTTLKKQKVYVALDKDALVPEWLSSAPQSGNAFTATDMTVAAGGKEYAVYVSEADKGMTYTLGSNVDASVSGSLNMYIVFFAEDLSYVWDFTKLESYTNDTDSTAKLYVDASTMQYTAEDGSLSENVIRVNVPSGTDKNNLVNGEGFTNVTSNLLLFYKAPADGVIKITSTCGAMKFAESTKDKNYTDSDEFEGNGYVYTIDAQKDYYYRIRPADSGGTITRMTFATNQSQIRRAI